MYKVLLIDDEEMALEYLQNLVDWEKYGFYIAGAVTTAGEAKKIVQSENPDVVISDICMPEQSGLEFCEYVLERNPVTKILFLSAYQEFEYARKAISVGALGYILKYELTEELLGKKLIELKNMLTEEENKQKNRHRHQIYDLVTGLFEVKVDRNHEDWKNMENGEYLHVFALIREDKEFEAINLKWREKTEKKVFMSNETFYKLSSEINGILNLSEAMILNRGEYLLLYNVPKNIKERQIRKEIEETLSAITAKMKEAYQKTSSAAYIWGEAKVENISAFYKRLAGFMDSRMFKESNYIFCAEDQGRKAEVPCFKEEADALVQKADREMQKQIFAEALRTIKRLFREYIIPNESFEQAMEICNELLTKLENWKNQYFYLGDETFLPEWLKLKPVFSFLDIEKIYIDIIEQMEKHLDDKELARFSYEIRICIQYLEKHYKEDISVNDISDHIGLSTSYLSRKFKSETGKTILEYLTMIRIIAAKQLLKENTYKIYEISEKVGYRTSQYFGEVFFRETGMSPGEYRREARGGNEKKYKK